MQSDFTFLLIACCPELDDPNNGKVNWTGLSPGDIATYMCDDDFKLNGEATRTCQDDGTWSGMAPTCERKYANN